MLLANGEATTVASLDAGGAALLGSCPVAAAGKLAAAEDPVPDGALDDPLIPEEEPALPEFAEPVVLPDVPPIAFPEALFS